MGHEESKKMAKSVNKVFLLGNVGKDPEIRSTPSGTMVANFTLATSDRFQDAQGNWQDRTEWHNLVAFKRLAEIVRDYVKKGSKLFIEGKIQTRSWEDKDTKAKRYRTEIIVNDLSLLSGRDDSQGGGGYSRSSSSQNAARTTSRSQPKSPTTIFRSRGRGQRNEQAGSLCGSARSLAEWQVSLLWKIVNRRQGEFK
jgi:single-strand DNA-binding protein